MPTDSDAERWLDLDVKLAFQERLIRELDSLVRDVRYANLENLYQRRTRQKESRRSLSLRPSGSIDRQG